MNERKKKDARTNREKESCKIKNKEEKRKVVKTKMRSEKKNC